MYYLGLTFWWVVPLTNLLEWDNVVSEFKLQSRCYVLFRTNTPGKDMNLHIPLIMGWTVPLLFFYKGDFGIK